MILILLAVGLVSGFAAGMIAAAKGYDRTGYFVLGFFLPLVGILVAGFMPDRSTSASTARSTSSSSGTPTSRAMVPGDPASAFNTGGRAENVEDAVPPMVDRLFALDAPGSTRVADFVQSRSDEFGGLLDDLGMVETGERLVALGAGWWFGHQELFILTDKRLVFGGTFGVTSTVWVSKGQMVELSARGLALSEGTLSLVDGSPFDASDLKRLIEEPEEALRFIDLGEPVSSSSEIDVPEPLGSEDAVSKLERLDALRQSGVIDDTEFAELKRQFIWGDDGADTTDGRTA